MFIIIAKFSAFLGLLLAIFKDYLKLNRMWPRKHEPVVADSISIAALIIEMINAIPYLILVMFVYHDWLVTLRTLSSILLAIITLIIGVGFWVHSKRGKSLWTLLLETFKIGGHKPQYEILLVPQEGSHISTVKEHYPHLSLVPRGGGHAFVIETCASLKNAQLACQKYEYLGLYVTCVELV